MKFNDRIFKEFICASLYKASLDYMYLNFQVPLFGYAGFCNEGEGVRLFIGWGIYFFLYSAICSVKSDTSSLFTYIIFFISISPFITLYQYNLSFSLWMLVSQGICLLMINYILSLGRKMRFRTIGSWSIFYNNKFLRLLVFVFIVCYFVISFVKFGIPSLRSFLFEEVYNTRAAVSLSSIQSIIQNLMCKVVLPISMLISFREKKWILFTLFMFSQIYFYAITGFKTYLFIPIAIICLISFSKLDLRKTIVFGLPILTVGTMLMYIITNNLWIYGILGNRLLFLPARIKYAYFDYFSNNPFISFSQSTLARLLMIESNYEGNIRYIIGAEYFNKPNMWTNTGFMADAYANLGFLGMALMGIILALVLNLLVDKLCFVPEDLKKGLQAIFVIFFIALNDGAAISILGSGGMLFAVILVSVIRFCDEKDYSRKRMCN